MPTVLPKVFVRAADAAPVAHYALAAAGRPTVPGDLPDEVRRAVKSLNWDASAPKGARRESSWGQGRSVSVTQIGPAGDCDAKTIDEWLAAELAIAAKNGIAQVAIVLPKVAGTKAQSDAVRVLRQLALAGYRFSEFRDSGKKNTLKTLAVIPPRGLETAYKRALPQGRAVGAGMRLARDLGNTPPNVATPAWMASQARALAKRHGMKAEVLTPPQMKKLGMGGILGVGQGSVNTPRMVRLRYGTKGPHVALVGKGVTFDTGGISLKPPASMEEMKYDKCGACTVLGIAEAVGTLRLNMRLSVYVPLAENMPDAAAYRPSDIVTCYNGKTVEIINTDAEGRMILADALSWAAEDGPDQLLEFSTLTGACVVALGEGAAALYTPSERLAGGVLKSADQVHERLWRMPLWPEFVNQMKGTHSDLKNSGPRWGGSNTAAAFLAQFVGELEHWAHIDIAGPAYASNAEGRGKRGATGFAVPFTVDYLMELAQG